MSDNFKIGDPVQLKIGGPKMLIYHIEEVDGILKAWCEWVEKDKRCEGTFAVTSLKHISV